MRILYYNQTLKAQIGGGTHARELLAALYKGLALGCKTYIVALPGKEYMEAVIESGYARLVKSPKEISLNKGDLFEEYNKDYFFADNWRERLDPVMELLELGAQ